MKRWHKAAAVVAVLAAFGLSGCTSAVQDRQSLDGGYGLTDDGYIKTRDGRQVYCLFWNKGLSCDWSNAK
ncbi:membrane protein [Mycobacterium phage Chaser]|nr:membrane protein [Mycobacterium phage Chaser]